ncbi:MAG: transpeptidase family protein [Deltaproteobacteria bacterium]|nr:transpeptidase family protein [Deltaproteobacteria bacterium]
MSVWDDSRQKWIRIRILLVTVVILLATGRIMARSYELQVSKHDHYAKRSYNQYKRSITLPPGRATILDRNGAELAISVMVPSVYADPRDVRSPGAAAAALSPIIGVEEHVVLEKLMSNRHFVWLKRRAGPEAAEAVSSLEIKGIFVTKESKRFYPNRRLASHVLGFAGYDSVGLEGIELKFDDELIGASQVMSGLRDAMGRLILSDGLQETSPSYENSVVLSIDKAIQTIVEEELRSTAQLFEALSAMAVVVRPSTGEILALANYPDFDPNHFGTFAAADRRNRALTDRFEPGSTMKIFTMAAALASGKVKPSDVIFCENGRYTVDDLVIHDAHRDGWLTPLQILQRSSNVGAAKVSALIGKRQLYRYLSRFGFGTATGVPFPGETAGFLRHYSKWYPVDLASISFGHGISVSGLQMVMALSAVANGGRLLEPILVKKVVAKNGTVIKEFKPRLKRKVIDGRTARILTSMLVAVTEEGGTGTEAGLEGFPVAGKTGTAQKVDFVTGGYAKDQWTASFIGFVPADDPELAIVVIVDDPVINYYGGVVAAPTFKRIADRSLRYLGIAPYSPGKIKAAPKDEAVEEAPVPEQGETPPGGGVQEDGAVEAAGGEAPVCTGDCVEVPQFTGKGLAWVLETAYAVGLDPSISGAGRVSSQSPAAGTLVPRGTSVSLTLEPVGW